MKVVRVLIPQGLFPITENRGGECLQSRSRMRFLVGMDVGGIEPPSQDVLQFNGLCKGIYPFLATTPRITFTTLIENQSRPRKSPAVVFPQLAVKRIGIFLLKCQNV
jgi:hypothetical protein